MTEPAADTARPWRRAALWLLFLGQFFFASYGAANWLASLRSEVGAVVFDWERSIPFVPWTIIPYWSIDVLYVISLFICTTAREVDTHARRLLTAQIIAVTCFIVFPLRFTFTGPDTGGFAGFLFDSLGEFDLPFNQAPSLHIALLVIVWDRFARHLPRWALWPAHAWFALIGVSVLTTYQHHFIDIPTGALLGFLCLWLWPERGPSPLAGFKFTTDGKRRRLAAIYVGAAMVLAVAAIAVGGIWLWLLCPAVSLALVTANYAAIGAAGFQKAPDGRMSIAARWLFAPYIAAAWLNSRLWTRNDPHHVAIADGVMLGRLPSRRTAGNYASIVDLCAEIPGPRGSATYQAMPLLDLIAPSPDQLRPIAAAVERARANGSVLVCCALGYGRSAAAVAAWLLASGRAPNAAAAIEHVRRVRPRIVLTDAACATITEAARSHP